MGNLMCLHIRGFYCIFSMNYVDMNCIFFAKGNLEKLTILGDDGSTPKSSSDDVGEAIADGEPNVIPSSECLPGVSNLSLEDSKVEAPKRQEGEPFLIEKVNCIVIDSLTCLLPKIQRMRMCAKTLKQRHWNLNMAHVMFLFWLTFHQALGRQI